MFYFSNCLLKKTKTVKDRFKNPKLSHDSKGGFCQEHRDREHNMCLFSAWLSSGEFPTKQTNHNSFVFEQERRMQRKTSHTKQIMLPSLFFSLIFLSTGTHKFTSTMIMLLKQTGLQVIHDSTSNQKTSDFDCEAMVRRENIKLDQSDQVN